MTDPDPNADTMPALPPEPDGEPPEPCDAPLEEPPCLECDGGKVSMAIGPGRTLEVSPGVFRRIPADLPIATCERCGQRYISIDEAETIDATEEAGAAPTDPAPAPAAAEGLD
jgi:hypothetical protein